MADNEPASDAVPEAPAEQTSGDDEALLRDLAAKAASMRGAIDKALLACTTSRGLFANLAQMAELQSHFIGRADEVPDAARLAGLMAMSPGSIEAARQHAAFVDASRRTTAAFDAVRDLEAFTSGPIQRLIASMRPLLEIRPDLRGRWGPPNWPLMTLEEEDVAVGILNEGIPLVWVPRAATVRALIDASDYPARETILAASRDDVATDCKEVLADVKSADLRDLVELAESAVDTLRSGFCPGAQALAANIFDTWLRDAVSRNVKLTAPRKGKGFYSEVAGQLKPIDDDTLLAEFQEACVLAPGLEALKPFQPSSGVPASRYGRHPTSHRVGPDQYTDANAIIAVMLVVSILRQAEESGW